jgi:hypothetical protein
MTDVGQRVQLVQWPGEANGKLKLGARGTVLSDHQRYVMVRWDGLQRPLAMRPEEVALVREGE